MMNLFNYKYNCNYYNYFITLYICEKSVQNCIFRNLYYNFLFNKTNHANHCIY